MKKITLLFAVLFCAGITLQAELKIVKDGKSSYQVVVGKDCPKITRAAAKDLILYLRKSTGAKLSFNQTSVTGNQPSIVVGDCAASRKAGIDAAKLPPEGFVIKTVGRNLYIVGRDTKGSANSDHWYSAPQSGTWNGVSHFLQSQLGIRWFMPGTEGEYIPQVKNLTIGNIDISDAPQMNYRRMSYLWWKGLSKQRIKAVKLWKRRNMNGWSVRWRASHIWLQRMPAKKYFKQHPEWFALVNGRRLEYAPHGVQMCTTNSGALDAFSQSILRDTEHLKATFSLSPNDGGGHCECTKCRALDVEKLPNGDPVLTDRYVTYCNEVAKRVLAKDPTKTFGFYAYSFYSNPPRKTKLNSSVRVMHVLNDTGILYYSPEIRKLYVSKKLLPWKQAVGELYFYTTPSGMGNIALPNFHKTSIKHLFADLKRVGVTGISMNNVESFDATGLNNYLYEQLAWNPSADIDTLYSDALDKCYGKAAAPYVEKYFATVEAALAKYADSIRINMALGSAKRFPGLLEISYNDLFQKGIPFLKQALAQSATKNQKIRLQMVVDNLKYCRDTVELYQLSKKVLKSKPSRAEVLKAIKLAERRRAYLKRLAKAGRLNMKRILTTEKGSYLPFDPQIYRTLLVNLSGGVRKATVSWLKKGTAPKLDGKLNDPCWAKAKPFTLDYDNRTGVKIKLKTIAKAAYDSKYLYLGVYCQEPKMAEIKDSCRKLDDPVWNENNLDIFFAPKNSKDLKHIIVNSLGTICDVDMPNGKNNMAWNSNTKTAVSRTKDGWIVEMAIPFSQLSGKTPRIGAIWGFNLCRVRPMSKQYFAFSPTFGLFAKPERFGKLIFK
jgi:Domain of unknown function (DUF4838)/Carbohydrate family 9 binding domain-like